MVTTESIAESGTGDYQAFLASKRVYAESCGFDPILPINPMLFPFQQDIVRWALRGGKRAVFAHTGLGKGPIQMEWCRQVCAYTGNSTLILAPLAVAQQFQREAAKFHVEVNLCEDQSDVKPGINITNYDRFDKFDVEYFAGVAMDESSCIKDWTSKTTQTLIEKLRNTPFKLCSTATPSPNNHAELGTHAELLDVMSRTQMLAMFFEHDGGDTGKWALKGHGKKPYFKFVSSWAVCLKLPSDLGYDDSEFILPPLRMHEHIVPVDYGVATEGMLFRCPDMSATGLHKEMRLTCDDRARKTAEIVASKPDEQWIIWVNTNYEADAIRAALPKAIEARGSHTPKRKIEIIAGFLDQKIDWLLSKGSMFGYGLNLQCCHNMVFVGLSYSFETIFQCIRRCLRFGQMLPVDAHLVIAETEGPVLQSFKKKEAQYQELQAEMNEAMKEEQLLARHKKTRYAHEMSMEIPEWLVSQTEVAA